MGKYFFGDYCGGWIKTLDPTTKTIADFASGINRPLDVAVGADGAFYFIARNGIGGGSDEANTSSTNGVLWKVTYTGSGQPVVAVQPVSKTVSAGQPTAFTIVASGTPTPTYQWQRDGAAIAGPLRLPTPYPALPWPTMGPNTAWWSATRWARLPAARPRSRCSITNYPWPPLPARRPALPIRAATLSR
ncbi:MAG: hypothetical protein WKG07_09390 [Hymenobacter sp.]